MLIYNVLLFCPQWKICVKEYLLWLMEKKSRERGWRKNKTFDAKEKPVALRF